MNNNQMGMALAGLLLSVTTLYRLRKLNLFAAMLAVIKRIPE
jgi:hypothetical protein